MSTYLIPNSTQPQLNFNKTSTKSHLNLSPKLTWASISTSNLTTTQYGCDIKATQSCFLSFHILRFKPILCSIDIYDCHQFKEQYFSSSILKAWTEFPVLKLISSSFTEKDDPFVCRRSDSEYWYYTFIFKLWSDFLQFRAFYLTSQTILNTGFHPGTAQLI